MSCLTAHDAASLRLQIDSWAHALGLSGVTVSTGNTQAAAPRLAQWLAQHMHGEMAYMQHHAALRADPQALVPGTLSILSVRLPYWPEAASATETLATPELGYISRYALGRDYHKIFRQKLQKLADRIAQEIGPFGYRVFSDSAPVMEVEFASQSGLGWRGKHSLLLTREGSWHFLGEIYTDLALPADPPVATHCGHCTACLAECPTQAIIAPYTVDARRCISYLTIEHPGSIPETLRPLMGNRIYGCDDCQLACPWNRFARQGDAAFAPRYGLDGTTLLALFAWDADTFDARLAGSPIRRIGHERWLRNLAVALGNALRAANSNHRALLEALNNRLEDASPLVREHILWAIRQYGLPHRLDRV